MLKTGDQIKCVGLSRGLTIGKTYTVEKVQGLKSTKFLRVVNDEGFAVDYFMERFKKICD